MFKKKKKVEETKKEDELTIVSQIVLLLKKQMEFMAVDIDSIKARFKKKIPMNEEAEEKEDIKNPNVFLPSETGV